MLVNENTRRIMAHRKFRRDMLRNGWEEVGEGGGRLWELVRGDRTYARIVDAKVAPDGLSVWVNVEPKQHPPYVWEKPAAPITQHTHHATGE